MRTKRIFRISVPLVLILTAVLLIFVSLAVVKWVEIEPGADLSYPLVTENGSIYFTDRLNCVLYKAEVSNPQKYPYPPNTFSDYSEYLSEPWIIGDNVYVSSIDSEGANARVSIFIGAVKNEYLLLDAPGGMKFYYITPPILYSDNEVLVGTVSGADSSATELDICLWKVNLDKYVISVYKLGEITKGKVDELKTKKISPISDLVKGQKPEGLKVYPLPGLEKEEDFSKDLAAYWSFDNANLVSYNGENTLENINGVEFEWNDYNNSFSDAANFSAGKQSYLNISDDSQIGLDITKKLTISAWIKLNSIVGHHAILGKSMSYKILTLNENGKIEFLCSSDESTHKYVWSNTSISTNTWCHIACVYNGLDMRIYINGKLDIAPLLYNGGMYNSSAPFQIGRVLQIGGPVLFMDGLIDEVAIYKRALSPEEIGIIAKGDKTIEELIKIEEEKVFTASDEYGVYLTIQDTEGSNFFCLAPYLDEYDTKMGYWLKKDGILMGGSAVDPDGNVLVSDISAKGDLLLHVKPPFGQESIVSYTPEGGFDIVKSGDVVINMDKVKGIAILTVSWHLKPIGSDNGKIICLPYKTTVTEVAYELIKDNDEVIKVEWLYNQFDPTYLKVLLYGSSFIFGNMVKDPYDQEIPIFIDPETNEQVPGEYVKGAVCYEQEKYKAFVSTTNIGNLWVIEPEEKPDVVPDIKPPDIKITAPVGESYTNTTEVKLSAIIQDDSKPVQVSLSVNGAEAPIYSYNFDTGQLDTTVTLKENQMNDIVITATDSAGNEATELTKVVCDKLSPEIELKEGQDGAVVNTDTAKIIGTVVDANIDEDSLTVNGESVQLGPMLGFSKEVGLNQNAENVITISVSDKAGNPTTKVLKVTHDNKNPTITIDSKFKDFITEKEQIVITGTYIETNPLTIKVKNGDVDCGVVNWANGTFSATVKLTLGNNAISAMIEDKAGNPYGMSIVKVKYVKPVPKYPDLIISSAGWDKWPNPSKIKIAIKNIGQAKIVSKPIELKFIPYEQPAKATFKLYENKSLLPGNSFVAEIKVSDLGINLNKISKIIIIVDPGDAIQESNEKNNAYQLKVPKLQ